MPALNFTKSGILLILLVTISCILTLVSMTTSYWVQQEFHIKDKNLHTKSWGLWQGCSYVGEETHCNYYTAIGDAVRAWRAFSIISCISAIVGLGLAIISSVEYVTGYAVSIACFITALSTLLTCITFTATNTWVSVKYIYCWSYVLSWVSMLFSIASCCWAVMKERYNGLHETCTH